MRHLTQEELVQACLQREAGAWPAFVERYGNLIYSTILKVGLPADEQEEAFQSTIVALYQQLPKLRDPARLVSWIVGIAWRQGVNRIRARSKTVSLDLMEEEGRLHLEDIHAGGPSAEEMRQTLERAQWAEEALRSLPDKCRRLLEMLFYEDPPPDYQEIARRFGTPIGSLGPTRARCLARMKRFLEERNWKI